MIVIPMSFDQPAVAARLERCGVAVVLPVKGISANEIRGALLEILNQPGYRDAAIKMKAAIRASRGLKHAADVIENSLKRVPESQPREQLQLNFNDTLVTTE